MLCRPVRGIGRTTGQLSPELDHLLIFAALDICLLRVCHVHASPCNGGRPSGRPCGRLVSFLGAYSKKPRKRYRTPQETVCLVLGLCCGVVWKITGAEVWGRLGIACIFVGGGYRAFYRAIDRIKMAAGGPGPGDN